MQVCNVCSYSVICNLLTKLTYGTVQETIDNIILCDVYIFLHFYCHGMRSVMLQINEYDDDDDDDDDHTMTV